MLTDATKLCKVFLTMFSVSTISDFESDLRRYREEAGLSQEALARRVDVSRQTIANIEGGVSEPKVLLALALAVALGVLVTDLFRRAPSL
jgi:DNA-binding XRE family transcriptional regulator